MGSLALAAFAWLVWKLLPRENVAALLTAALALWFTLALLFSAFFVFIRRTVRIQVPPPASTRRAAERLSTGRARAIIPIPTIIQETLWNCRPVRGTLSGRA